MSSLIQDLCFFMTDYDSEKVFKNLGERRDVDDAYLRLDSLTIDGDPNRCGGDFRRCECGQRT